MDDLYGDGERAGSIGSVGIGAGAAVSGAGVSGDDVGERGVGSSGVGHGSSSAFVGGEDGGEDVDEELVDPDTEQLVQEAMNRIPSRGEVLLELRQCEIDDNTLVHNFMTKTCSCTKWGGQGMLSAIHGEVRDGHQTRLQRALQTSTGHVCDGSVSGIQFLQ